MNYLCKFETVEQPGKSHYFWFLCVKRLQELYFVVV